MPNYATPSLYDISTDQELTPKQQLSLYESITKPVNAELSERRRTRAQIEKERSQTEFRNAAELQQKERERQIESERKSANDKKIQGLVRHLQTQIEPKGKDHYKAYWDSVVLRDPRVIQVLRDSNWGWEDFLAQFAPEKRFPVKTEAEMSAKELLDKKQREAGVEVDLRATEEGLALAKKDAERRTDDQVRAGAVQRELEALKETVYIQGKEGLSVPLLTESGYVQTPALEGSWVPVTKNWLNEQQKKDFGKYGQLKVLSEKEFENMQKFESSFVTWRALQTQKGKASPEPTGTTPLSAKDLQTLRDNENSRSGLSQVAEMFRLYQSYGDSDRRRRVEKEEKLFNDLFNVMWANGEPVDITKLSDEEVTQVRQATEYLKNSPATKFGESPYYVYFCSLLQMDKDRWTRFREVMKRMNLQVRNNQTRPIPREALFYALDTVWGEKTVNVA